MADDERDAEVATSLGALLEPHLGGLEPAPEAPEPAPPPRRLDEGELMALIFEHLDDDNPRVCEGVDFDRLTIMSEATRAHADAPSREAEPARGAEPESEPAPLDPAMAEAWIGATWAEELAPLPAAALTHPELDPDQRQLLARARRRRLDSVNLRHLSRAAAVRHFELFIRLCRARGLDLCRVITGKGVHSRDEPVIKRAVVEWCRGEGRAAVLTWAPDLDHHGEWGAVVLRLSSARRSGTTRP
jgi:DNA-nicking Smr family endonuclease